MANNPDTLSYSSITSSRSSLSAVTTGAEETGAAEAGVATTVTSAPVSSATSTPVHQRRNGPPPPGARHRSLAIMDCDPFTEHRHPGPVAISNKCTTRPMAWARLTLEHVFE